MVLLIGMASKEQRTKARERRTDKRVIDVGIGRKRAKDAIGEEIVEEAFDWLERGGWRRIYNFFKFILLGILFLIALAILIIFEIL